MFNWSYLLEDISPFIHIIISWWEESIFPSFMLWKLFEFSLKIMFCCITEHSFTFHSFINFFRVSPMHLSWLCLWMHYYQHYCTDKTEITSYEILKPNYHFENMFDQVLLIQLEVFAFQMWTFWRKPLYFKRTSYLRISFRPKPFLKPCQTWCFSTLKHRHSSTAHLVLVQSTCPFLTCLFPVLVQRLNRKILHFFQKSMKLLT